MSREAMQQALEALMMMRDEYEEYACPGYACPACDHADAAITTLRKALAEPDQYAAQNPLGGPAKVFDAMADAIRAGDDYHATLRRYGFAEVNALAEPEQEPVAWNWMLDGQPHGPPYYGPPPDETFVRNGLANGRSVRLLYAAPTPQREHITDGSPCWCNPDVFEEDGGNVIVHNYEDNWQQYAKPGETAQQCIERHRAEQDALMKLYATPRKPQTTHWEGCEAVHPECAARRHEEQRR